MYEIFFLFPKDFGEDRYIHFSWKSGKSLEIPLWNRKKNRLDEFVIEYSHWLLMERYSEQPHEDDTFVNRREHFD